MVLKVIFRTDVLNLKRSFEIIISLHQNEAHCKRKIAPLSLESVCVEQIIMVRLQKQLIPHMLLLIIEKSHGIEQVPKDKLRKEKKKKSYVAMKEWRIKRGHSS